MSTTITRHILISAMIGTLLEWYDIFIFSTGAFYVAANFMPSGSPVAAIASTLLIFAIGFLFRPLGAFVFGHYGDKIGRKNMLMYTIVISGLSSGIVGLLPTYAQIGVWAIVLLVIMRLLLGFGLGGEWGGAMLVALEHGQKRRGYWSSFVQSTVGMGLVLGSIVFLVLGAIIGQSAMVAWGWRIAFLISFLLMAIGFYIRYTLPETPVFEAAKKEKAIVSVPAGTVFTKYWRQLLLSTIIAGAVGTIWFTGSVTLPTIYRLFHVVTPELQQIGILLFGLIEILFVFLGGPLSDRIGRRPTIYIASIIFLVVLYPVIIAKSVAMFFVAMALLGIAHGIAYAPEGAMISEIFPTNVRYTGNSLAYQFGNAFIGGPQPYVSVDLGAISYLLEPVYAVVFAVIAIVAAYKFKETKDVDLTKVT
ncbi:MAG TPA: MFS transporter [Nitrososphaeria archaeon]|nr:MFS transporter [Nitrososphaeria archaeon]